jgi:glycosyltransferase involved in cell wall biosynthesis/predicted metal-dependent phosphoesterase TrpH
LVTNLCDVSRAVARADLHCHSAASEQAKLGVQRAVGLPECATPPDEVYELAKRRGMDFVTITDHDTIDGVLEIAHLHDVFVSEELTTHFKGEPGAAVHVLCYGITQEDHEWLQRHASDLERCATYLHEREIACALAHPFFTVRRPLEARHRSTLAKLFPVWEVRNGARARELNQPAVIYIDTYGGTGIGGSDDHAGVDIGRTYTETPHVSTPEAFLSLIRSGRATACGNEGSAAKWAHAAIALAARAIGHQGGGRPDPLAVLRMIERVVGDGEARSSSIGPELDAEEARAILRAWLESIGLEPSEQDLVTMMQKDGFSHADLYRRARSAHERSMRRTVERAIASADSGVDYAAAAAGLFEACTPVIPYVPATAFLGREAAKLVAREGETPRVALVVDGIGSMHGVTHTLDEIRARGVAGFEVEVIGTDPRVDRRLPASIDVEVPFYRGLSIGVPSLPAIVETLAWGRYDVVHLCTPGPAGVGAALVARIMGLPAVGSYHTELAAYAGLRSGDERLQTGMNALLELFYGGCRVVLSPSPSVDDSLHALGVERERMGRWDRGVDQSLFSPDRRVNGWLPGEINVLYAGRMAKEKGADVLVDCFLEARRRDPRLHLVLAGGGPEQERMRERLGSAATFLGWLEGEELARAYASAEMFLFASRTDTFGQVILEAQASGRPVVAVGEGGPAGLIEDGETGRLCAADKDALADVVVELAAASNERERLAQAALESVRSRSWERALSQLADGYARALGTDRRAQRRAA